MMPMTYAVHEGQTLLAEKAAEAASMATSDETLSLAVEETAYDVCWYCKSNLSLHVDETRGVTADQAREKEE